MKKNIIIVLIIMPLLSCGVFNNSPSSVESIDFVIVNSSDSEISDVEVSLAYETGVNTTIASIGIAETAQTTLDMKAASDVDGSYSIRYVIGRISYEKKFGYYSRGNPLCDRIQIEITDSGVQIKNSD